MSDSQRRQVVNSKLSIMHTFIYSFFIWLSALTGFGCEQCREGATFSGAAISPNLQNTHIMRVPNARTMSDCTTACCNQSGCDLSWMLGKQCYIVNCQHKESCEPQKMENMKSYLTFVLRPSPRFVPLSLYENFLPSRGYPLGGRDDSNEEVAHLKDLSFVNKDPSLEEQDEYPDDYSDPQFDFLHLSAKGDSKGNSDVGYLGWFFPEPEQNSSALEIGRRNKDAPDVQREETTMSNVVVHNVSEATFADHVTSTTTQADMTLPHTMEKNGPLLRESSSPLPSSSSLEKQTSFVAEKTGLYSTTDWQPEHQTVSGLLPNLGASTPFTATNILTVSTSKVPLQELSVSTGDSIQVILPKDEVPLNVFVTPEAPADMPYLYEWSLVNQPEDFKGQLEMKHTRTPKLSKLSAGLYLLRVAVSNVNAFGEGFVNLTVKPAPRVNQPPVAVVSPRAQEVSLPTSFTFIDGSQSTDDDKIVAYHWEEIKGPLQEQKASGDSPVLHLSGLVTGNYTFRLTVTDSDGATNSTTACVTVNKPVDYPPLANAGPNQVITLPQNFITLNGNKSSDDHHIVSYEWSLSPGSKGKVVAMQGVRSPYLQASAMQVGEYTFQLTVSDSSQQQSTAEVTVIVQPESNKPPVAVTGPDKELTFPVASTILEGSKSRDDQGIVSYEWENVSGPTKVTIEDGDKAVGKVTGLQVGVYHFRLTVKDSQGLSSSAMLSVTVKEENNSPPKAHAGGTHILVLPNNSISLDASKSISAQGLVSYLWTRDGQSPAAGDVLQSSDHEPVLQLTNLVEGIYLFHLKVTDARGYSDTDTATVEVRSDPRKQNLVELILEVGVGQLTEQQKDTLLRQLAVLLNVLDSDIKVQKIQAHSDLSTVIVFYVETGPPLKIQKAADVARTLQGQLLKEKAGFLVYKVLRVDTAVCLLKCSGHGQCDPITKSCLCYPFWTENLIQRYISDGESNCDWSVLYITVLTFALVAFLMGLTWLCICCCKSRKRTKIRKKTKYTILDNIDEQERMELRPKYGIKHRSTEHNSSLMVSESEFESDQDTIFSREKADRENPKNIASGAVKNGAPFNFSSNYR
ncbi:dyslexia-associated protein KIAA0319 homolog [Spea bombifrons]|uniref:dyslexia-associated protein KIAA0319 homolog n=1 Tax=Spea bombifrons TaxID=233779 RepID=UPI002349C177|nr:dyslexia-associated protein KIAA0319 homolog [Spea bombifrons]